MSLWALAAIVCALIPCPPFSVLGVGLGGIALLELRRRPHYRGRRLAQVALVVGFVACAGWIGGGAWWNANVRRPMIEGPRAALQRGLAGDVPGFMQRFDLPETASDADASLFLETVRERYGALLDTVAVNRDGSAVGPADVDRVAPRIDYEFTFERGVVPGQAVFVISDPAGGGLVLRFRSVTLQDGESGDLTYPDEVTPATSP